MHCSSQEQSDLARTISAISALALIEHVFQPTRHIIDADSLHDRYLEFARAGVVHHGEKGHLVEKLCDC